MASFTVEEFLGEGVLKGLIPKLAAGGWDDVPTIKMINPQDMEFMGFTDQQKDAFELRSYLHDHALMVYADKLEASGQSLEELLNTSTAILSSQFSMKRGHVARFRDRTTAYKISTMKLKGATSFNRSDYSQDTSAARMRVHMVRSSPQGSVDYDESSMEQSLADYKTKEGYMYKGIIAGEAAEPRLCGCIRPPPMEDDVAPYSSIESISVQKLVPRYKVGTERSVTTKASLTKASNIWRDKPAILLCIRRPGCVMCRAEAHQLYSRKAAFDALGFQLIAVLHEMIESEIKEFWPRYWGGDVVLDRNCGFYKALGGGELPSEGFVTGFLCNPRSLSNFRRARSMDIKMNFVGEGEIKGGLFIVGRGRAGIAYQFVERNFGDWAPIEEVLEVCSRMQELFSNEKEVLDVLGE